MLQMLSAPVRPRALVDDEVRAELRARMQKPQRHRLLHGYPLAAAMRRREVSGQDEDLSFGSAADRRLLMGVLPHPFCNPAVAGCGFCTFPHEKFKAAHSSAVVEHVIREIRERLHQQPELFRRPVAGLYFGGGTANLTPAEDFRKLCRALSRAFDFAKAEITLEGVPIYFLKRQPLLLDILREELPARHYRISMGIQSFDSEQLRRMGRLAFGNRDTFREVVDVGHRLGFTVSADLLFNLPGQTLAQMRHDLEQALAIGLDHLGLYHLVLFSGLGTTWSRDPEMLSALPANEEAAQNWLALQEMMLKNGFYQATLTNFERREFKNSARRFQYEENSFQPERFDMLGFGPSAISCAADASFTTALKTLNPVTADGYIAAVQRGPSAWDRYFHYGRRDLQIFYLTRRLAALAIHRRDYFGLFGTDPTGDFCDEIAALADEGLIEVRADLIRPTPLGVFYADSIAALLAWRRLQGQRSLSRQGDAEEGWLNDNGRAHM